MGEAHRRPPRALIHTPSDDLPQRQLASDIRAQRRCDPQASSDSIHDPDRTDRAAFLQLGCLFEGTQNGEVVFVLQRQSDRRHFLGCAVGEMRQGSMVALALLAGGLPQEDTALGGAIGSGAGRLGEIHHYNTKVIFPQMVGWQKKSSDYESSSKRAANP